MQISVNLIKNFFMNGRSFWIVFSNYVQFCVFLLLASVIQLFSYWEKFFRNHNSENIQYFVTIDIYNIFYSFIDNKIAENNTTVILS